MALALLRKEETMVEAAAGATLESADILQIMS